MRGPSMPSWWFRMPPAWLCFLLAAVNGLVIVVGLSVESFVGDERFLILNYLSAVFVSVSTLWSADGEHRRGHRKRD